jgi:hypothetical protein
MKLRRRETELFSLSFMDCICCGFGAIILLLVLTDVDQPVIIERARVTLNAQLLRLQEELFDIRGDTDELRRELQGRIRDLESERVRLSRLQGDLTEVQGQFSASSSDAEVTNIVQNEMVAAYQELTAEMERLQRQPRPRTAAPVASVGGIPVDSEYVIFVIDTSGSMVGNHWQSTNAIMGEILDIYPSLKGLQVMNDQGRFMFEGGAPGQWLTDSAQLRQRIRSRLPEWAPYSQSNPLPGILTALRLYREAGRKLSIVVIGDEFTGDSMQVAVDRIARLNAPGSAPRARIHAIGFPESPGMPAFTNIQFSALMRVVTVNNDGTFVGMTNERQCRVYTEVLGVRVCAQ